MVQQSERPAVLVWSGPMCSGCEEVKAYLHEHDIAFDEKNIRGDIATMIEFRRKGYEILPVVEVGDQVVSEYESLDQVKALLQEAGYV